MYCDFHFYAKRVIIIELVLQKAVSMIHFTINNLLLVMSLSKKAMTNLVFIFLTMAVCGLLPKGAAAAATVTVYKVGDAAGWTTIGNVDYHNWAATKTFHVGDTIVFEYDPKIHNVMEVTHPEFRSCNATSPIIVYSTGNDSITIKSHGHYYYLCGFPGHCQAGQKVDIRVLRSSNQVASFSDSPSPSSFGLEPSAFASDPISPSPAESSAPSILYSKLWCYITGLSLCVSYLA